MDYGTRHPRLLIVDGADDKEGRGLMVLSALSLVAGELTGVEVRILNGDEPVVRTAAEVLSRDTGLSVSVAPRSADSMREMEAAALYVAVVASPAARLAVERVSAHVPAIVAVQFPGKGVDAYTLSLLRAAHDPRVLGRVMLTALGLPQ
jgi:hypothetical protein